MATKKVVIICKNTQFHGKKMNFSHIGEAQIDGDGTIEVPEELAEQLVQTDDWEYVKSSAPAAKAKKTEKPAAKVEETEEEEEETEESEEEATEEEESEEEDASKSTENTAEEQPKEEEVDQDLKKALIRKFTGPNAEAELKTMATQAGVKKTVIDKAKGKTDLINMILSKMELADKVALLKAQS